MTGLLGFFDDGFGKVVPAADAFVGVVPNGFGVGLDLGQDLKDGLGEVFGIGRRANLVRDDV